MLPVFAPAATPSADRQHFLAYRQRTGSKKKNFALETSYLMSRRQKRQGIICCRSRSLISTFFFDLLPVCRRCSERPSAHRQQVYCVAAGTLPVPVRCCRYAAGPGTVCKCRRRSAMTLRNSYVTNVGILCTLLARQTHFSPSWLALMLILVGRESGAADWSLIGLSTSVQIDGSFGGADSAVKGFSFCTQQR